ncbi:hypothetical protein J6590_027903, partial [Homalodisca vitripennis]
IDRICLPFLLNSLFYPPSVYRCPLPTTKIVEWRDQATSLVPTGSQTYPSSGVIVLPNTSASVCDCKKRLTVQNCEHGFFDVEGPSWPGLMSIFTSVIAIITLITRPPPRRQYSLGPLLIVSTLVAWDNHPIRLIESCYWGHFMDSFSSHLTIVCPDKRVRWRALCGAMMMETVVNSRCN